jgi:hypothetical protein
MFKFLMYKILNNKQKFYVRSCKWLVFNILKNKKEKENNWIFYYFLKRIPS